MDPFFGNRSWYHQPDPRYTFSHSPSYSGGLPIHRVDPWETRFPVHTVQRPVERSPSQKVVRIPVQFVGSKKVDPSGSATKIQKVFRAFLVRKCLKKIKEINVQVDAIEERLSDSKVVELVRKDEKERLRMNETLMSLLIKLDSICGLDFGVRQCRKAVIRKAIALQEKIDAIASSDLKETGENYQEIEIPVAASTDNTNQFYSPEKPNDDSTENAGAIENSIEHPEFPEIASRPGGNEEETEVIDVGVDREVKVCEANGVGDYNNNPNSIEDATVSMGNIAAGHERGSGADENRANRELLERMMEENEKMMSMMTQLFEKNDSQMKMLNALTHRVEALEKAFACERQRKKNKKKQVPLRRED